MFTLDAYTHARAWVLSSTTGDVRSDRPLLDDELEWFHPPIPCGRDVDGDGLEDIFDVSDGVVLVRSSRTGGIVSWFDARGSGSDAWGRVSSAGDFDGDGVTDLMVVRGFTSSSRPESLFASMISGSDGRVLLEIRDSNSCADEFADIAAIGDVDGDGQRDLALTYWVSRTRSCEVEVLSGKDGAFLRRYRGIPSVHLSMHVQDAGDLDGDGVHDLLVGSEEADVRLYSGCDGRLMFEEKRERAPRGPAHWEWTGFGTQVASFVDARGAGHLLLGTPEARGLDGAVECWSIADHRLEFVRRPPPDHDDWHFGSTIEVLGDVGGDETPDFACSPMHFECANAGRVYACSGRTGEIIWSAVRTLAGVKVERGT